MYSIFVSSAKSRAPMLAGGDCSTFHESSMTNPLISDFRVYSRVPGSRHILPISQLVISFTTSKHYSYCTVLLGGRTMLVLRIRYHRSCCFLMTYSLPLSVFKVGCICTLLPGPSLLQRYQLMLPPADQTTVLDTVRWMNLMCGRESS